MNVDLYARQSKGDASVQQQLKQAAQKATERGWTIVATFSDRSVSASSGEPRPGYDAMIEHIKAGHAKGIVVRHYDRLYRQPRELEDVIDDTEGVKIESVYGGGYDLGTADGRMQARVVGAFARGEVEKKAERQRDGALRDAEAGRPRMGSPRPFGWLEDRRTRHPEEARAVADAYAAVLAGGTISGICREWARRGLRPHQAPFGPLRAQPWTRTSITTILRNPRNAGISTYRGKGGKRAEVGKGDWEPLVAEETFRAVVAILGDPDRSKAPGVRTMLGGLARCRCGNIITASSNALGQPSYRCDPPGRAGRVGPHVAIRREQVDAFMDELVVARLQDPEFLEAVMADAGPDMTGLRQEAEAIRARMSRLGGLYALGDITEADLIGGRQKGQQRLDEIAAVLADAGRESVLAPLLAAQAVRSAWERLSTDRKRAVIDVLMEVTLFPAGRGVKTFRPEVILPEGTGIRWKSSSA